MPRRPSSPRKLRIGKACTAFLDALSTDATDQEVFVILDEVARSRGLQISAEQRGISGTFLSFKIGSE